MTTTHGVIKARTAALAASVLAVAGFGAGSIMGTGTASAQPVEKTLNYSCEFHDGSTLLMTSKVSATFPESVLIGENTPAMGIYASFKFGRGLDTKINGLTSPKVMASIETRSVREVNLTGANSYSLVAPTLAIRKSSPGAFYATTPPLDLAEPFEFQEFGSQIPINLQNVGTSNYSLGAIRLYMKVRDSSGNVISENPDGGQQADFYPVDCTPNAGQDLTLGTLVTKD